MFGIDAKKSVNAEAFVREPVDKETNNILRSKNNKIEGYSKPPVLYL